MEHRKSSKDLISREAFDWKQQLRNHIRGAETLANSNTIRRSENNEDSRSSVRGVQKRIKIMKEAAVESRYASQPQMERRTTDESSDGGGEVKRYEGIRHIKQSMLESKKGGFMKTTESSLTKQLPKRSFKTPQPSKLKSSSITNMKKAASGAGHPSTTAFQVDENNKENSKQHANKQLNDIKTCLEDVQMNNEQLKDNRKVALLQRTSQNPLLQLHKKLQHQDQQKDSSRSRSISNADASEDRVLPLGHVLPPPYKEFGVQTDFGTVRKSNEDRVCIIQRISKDNPRSHFAPCAYFSLFDGHGGPDCADFLRDELYQLVTRTDNFILDKRRGLIEGLQVAETRFLAKAKIEKDVSGSCALIAIVETERCYVANVGDSRLLVVSNKGYEQVTRDHKPECAAERDRILKAGGRIYRTCIETSNELLDAKGSIQQVSKEYIVGPFRVDPGGLSLSRSIGDIRAKDANYGGNSSCLISSPELHDFKLGDAQDFMILACDGIFDVLSNDEVVKAVKLSLTISASKLLDHKTACNKACSDLIELAKKKNSKDNLTVILVLFKDLSYFK